ncbi:hypothetical protein GFB49_09965 [Epibacterium sp. SM1979]|uniref:Lipoprotein n=2 Tax=Tritonibacter litoralis TaxID=2662264 RepID=A0A843YI05_9RHOB|nr:hypothetical protein [Tritonibacter litoralis]
MLKKFTAGIFVSALVLSGCAEKSENVGEAYVSPLAFQSMSCKQIGQEARRVSARASTVAGVQDKNANNDAVATGVALVLFFPAAFFIKGNKENAAELARLKGELTALEQAANAKNCGIEFAEKPANS